MEIIPKRLKEAGEHLGRGSNIYCPKWPKKLKKLFNLDASSYCIGGQGSIFKNCVDCWTQYIQGRNS